MRRAATLLGCLAAAAVVVGSPLADAVTGPTLALSESSPYEYVSGTTLYYAPTGTNSGSFTVTAKASAVSGIQSVAFPDVFGSDAFVDTTSPYAQTYSWASGASASGAKTVTATDKDAVPDLGTATFSLTLDTTPPSGQSIALLGGPGYSTLSVPLVLGQGSDSGAGVDSASGTVLRASAPLVGGVCGTFGAFAPVTLSGSTDTSVATASCYRYEYKVADRVGNVSAASAPSADAKIDVTPPTPPTVSLTGLTNAAAVGSTVYYRPGSGGSFAVAASASDPESGVASYSFPAPAGFTVLGTGASRLYTFPAGVMPPAAPLAVTATNGTGLPSTPAGFTLVPDGAAPTVTIRCNGKPCASTPYAKAVAVTIQATDAGAGIRTIRYSTDGRSPASEGASDYEGTIVVRSLTHLQVQAFDRVGNASPLVRLTVRSLADRLVFAAPLRLAVGAAARSFAAQLSASRRALVSAALRGPKLASPRRWQFILEPGASVVRIRLPGRLVPGGRYTVVWSARAGTRSASRTTRVVVGR